MEVNSQLHAIAAKHAYEIKYYYLFNTSNCTPVIGYKEPAMTEYTRINVLCGYKTVLLMRLVKEDPEAIVVLKFSQYDTQVLTTSINHP
jgi:hypothetical protein